MRCSKVMLHLCCFPTAFNNILYKVKADLLVAIYFSFVFVSWGPERSRFHGYSEYVFQNRKEAIKSKTIRGNNKITVLQLFTLIFVFLNWGLFVTAGGGWGGLQSSTWHQRVYSSFLYSTKESSATTERTWFVFISEGLAFRFAHGTVFPNFLFIKKVCFPAFIKQETQLKLSKDLHKTHYLKI